MKTLKGVGEFLLTADMKHLHAEIVALHATRETMLSDLRQSVAGLIANFGRARSAMAKRTKHERAHFVSHLRRSVATQRRHLQHDLAGAHAAWFGTA